MTTNHNPTAHEEAITLYSNMTDGVTSYWATCVVHGVIAGATADITKRTNAVARHLGSGGTR